MHPFLLRCKRESCFAYTLGRPARLLSVSPALLRFAGQLTGKSAQGGAAVGFFGD